MRFTLHIILCITTIIAFARSAFPYHLGDQLILKQLQATSRRITAFPTLWQVSHQTESWDTHYIQDGHIQYELLVEYPQPNAHPLLTLFYGPYRYSITIKDNSSSRVLTLKGPLVTALTKSNDASSNNTESIEGTSNHPLGTFDFAPLLAFHSDLPTTLFDGLKDDHFSGQFRIVQGLPLWIYDKESSAWRLEMIRHHFFPYRLTWKKNNAKLVQWVFHSNIDYQPWGIVDASLETISYQETDANPRPDSPPQIHTTWTLIQQFKQPSELTTWHLTSRAKSANSSSHSATPWRREDRIHILRSY